MKSAILSFAITLVTIQCNAQKSTEQFTDDFRHQIGALQSGEIKSLSLNSLSPIKALKLFNDKIDERDMSRHKDGLIDARDLKEIAAGSICKVSDSYVLIVAQDKRFGSLRAITISNDGAPIESFLLSDQLLYSGGDFYEVEARRYSPSRNYFFDESKDEFIFSSIFKIMEVDPEGQLIDFEWHQDETVGRIKIKVTQEGKFIQGESSPVETGELNLTEFTLISEFFSKDQKPSIDHKDEGGSVELHLGLGQTALFLDDSPIIHDQIFRVRSEKMGKFRVYQQYQTSLGFNGDGDYCTLVSESFTSDWEELEMKNDLFSIKKYSDQERKQFDAISLKQLKKELEKNCDEYHHDVLKNSKEEDIADFVDIKRINLKIEFTDASTNDIVVKYVSFLIPQGC